MIEQLKKSWWVAAILLVAFGAAAAQQLGAWRVSPHVAPAIRELLGEPEAS